MLVFLPNPCAHLKAHHHLRESLTCSQTRSIKPAAAGQVGRGKVREASLLALTNRQGTKDSNFVVHFNLPDNSLYKRHLLLILLQWSFLLLTVVGEEGGTQKAQPGQFWDTLIILVLPVL